MGLALGTPFSQFFEGGYLGLGLGVCFGFRGSTITAKGLPLTIKLGAPQFFKLRGYWGTWVASEPGIICGGLQSLSLDRSTDRRFRTLEHQTIPNANNRKYSTAL